MSPQVIYFVSYWDHNCVMAILIMKCFPCMRSYFEVIFTTLLCSGSEKEQKHLDVSEALWLTKYYVFRKKQMKN